MCVILALQSDVRLNRARVRWPQSAARGERLLERTCCWRRDRMGMYLTFRAELSGTFSERIGGVRGGWNKQGGGGCGYRNVPAYGHEQV